MEKRYLMALVLLVILIPITLSSCAPTGGAEPPAVPLETEDQADSRPDANTGPGLATVAPSPAEDSTQSQSATDEETEEIETSVMENDEDRERVEAETTEAGTVDAVTPVVVDLSKITPEPLTESEELREMPQPGIPNPTIAASSRAAVNLADELGVDVDSIQVISVAPAEWRDSSLGCPKPGQNYLMVITPGYLVILEVGGEQYEYHADMQGNVVRCSGQAQSGGVER